MWLLRCASGAAAFGSRQRPASRALFFIVHLGNAGGNPAIRSVFVQASRVTDEGEERLGHHLVLKQMIMLMDLLNIIASAAGQALRYSAHHHWFFGFVLFCYTFRLHDGSVHVRFSALDKRVDEIRKRLACDI